MALITSDRAPKQAIMLASLCLFSNFAAMVVPTSFIWFKPMMRVQVRRCHAKRYSLRSRERDPTAWTILQHDGPNHPGL